VSEDAVSAQEYEAPAGRTGPPLVVRAIWFVLVGWWLTGIVILAAYLLLITIIGIPLSFWLFDRIPFVLTLARPTARLEAAGIEQHPIFLRAIWFLFVGWWLGGIWMIAAYCLFVTIIGIPVGVVMLGWMPTVVTLQRR
jgi:uncharacterized membrane protein YccF (DUF307 family)